MSDPREQFVNDVEHKLINVLNKEQFDIVINTVILTLDNYEVQERCTDLVPVDKSDEDLVRMYCGSIAVEGKSPKTIKQYYNMLRSYRDYIGKPFCECGVMDFRKYFAYKLNSGASKSYVETIRAYLSAFYQWLYREELIRRNPMDKIKPIKCDVEKESPFSDTDVAIMRDHVNHDKRKRAILEFMLSTGVRVDELCSMDRNDVDFQNLSVHVRNGKGGKSRTTYISPVAAKYLRDYLLTRNDTDTALFLTERGPHRCKSDGLRLMLKKLEAETGVANIHPHRFRHTFATNMSKSGMPMQDIQILLGHSNISTTEIYVSTSQDQIRNKFMSIA